MRYEEASSAVARAADLLRGADAVLIAASNGFDIADGYNQFACDETFVRLFGDFSNAYGLRSMLQGIMARWPSEELRWSFLARLISYGYSEYAPSLAMETLDRLTAGKPRFVVTCNCNGRFERAGFDPAALFETEGSFARLRCTRDCADEDFEALPFVRRIRTWSASGASAGVSLAIPSERVPRCPRCGATLDVAVDDTGRLADTARFRSQQERFRSFLSAHSGDRITVLELGVGQANRAIKAPLMRFAESEPQASYIVLNRDEALLPCDLGDRAVSVRGDLADGLSDLATHFEKACS